MRRTVGLLLVSASACFSDPNVVEDGSGGTGGETTAASDPTSSGATTSSGTTSDSTTSGGATQTEGSGSTTAGSAGDTGGCSWTRFGENDDDDINAVTTDTWLDEEDPTGINGDDDELRADSVSAMGLTETSLVRFDVSALGEGTVAGAILHLSTNDDTGSESSPGSQFSLFAVGEPWVEAEASWNEAGVGRTWSVPGCGGSPCRAGGELVFFEPTQQGHTYDLDIDAELVASWRDDESSNHGLLLATLADNGAQFHSSESADSTMRPSLEVQVCR